MRLIITEEMWGVNHRNGGYRVRKTDEKTFECAVGALPPFPKGRRCFFIDGVKPDGNGITLSVHYENAKYNKSWTLTKDESVFYRPRSMDGGYQYTFELKD